METKRRKSRCKAWTKAGTLCRAATTEGGLCFFHANPNKASELGRIGGRSNRRVAAENGDPLPTLDNAIAVRDTAARLIADMHSGKLHHRVAAALASLLNLLLRAIEKTDLEQRVTTLEKRLAEAEPEGGVDGDAAVRPLRFGNPWGTRRWQRRHRTDRIDRR